MKNQHDTTTTDNYWTGLKELLTDKTEDLVSVLPKDQNDEAWMGVAWFLAADAEPVGIKPRLYTALMAKFGGYIDRENGGLSSQGKGKFGNHSKVLIAAECHRQIRQQQNQLVSREDSQEMFPESRRMVMLEKLTCHPLNAQIFEENDDEDAALIRDIEMRGLLEPLVITPRYVVISGHRRLRALLALGRTIAPVVLSEVKPEDEEESLLAYNLKRHMSNPEKIRVFSRYFEIERKRAAVRQHSGKDLPENFPEGGGKGDARDMAAKYVRLSGRSAEMGLRVLQEVENRRTTATSHDIKTVTEALNSSILAGHKAACRFGWFEKIPDKKMPVVSPAPLGIADAISSASASLKENPQALRLFRHALPTVRKALGPAVKADNVLALRQYGQALIAIADELEAQMPK